MGKILYETTTDFSSMIESRKYLLDFQKAALIVDLDLAISDDACAEILLEACMETLVDRVFYRLFGRGWNDLTAMEQREIGYAWKGK